MNNIKKTLINLSLIAPLTISLMAHSVEQVETQTKATQVSQSNNNFEQQVASYIKNFPYQDTYDYMMRYTGGDATKLNTWTLGEEPLLVKAGDDKIVRMNNDTFYKLAFVSLKEGPVYLASSESVDNRFYSFQLMDDRNVNYHNVINPSGDYTLYHGKKPANIKGEAIEVPSEISVIIVRVEVKDKNNANDNQAAEKVFNGISINGPTINEIAPVDLLSNFSSEVTVEAERLIDNKFKSTPLKQLIARLDQEVGTDISYLNLAAGTKCCWGGPDPSHSDYELIFNDEKGEILDGRKGNYSFTTQEPPVDAFWSITVYDTNKGGFLHPNKDDRYHINNTSAVKNEDGTVTFNFKQQCLETDLNCLEVPAQQFDLAARYYLPKEVIISGQWTLPSVNLVR